MKPASPSDASGKLAAIETHSRQAGEFAASYQQLAANHYSDCFAYSRHRLARLLDAYIPREGRGLRALDAGCGTGHHLAALLARGFDIAGVDGSEAMLAEARSRLPGADLRRADVESLPFADGAFDLVICIEVLRYLPRPEPCLREIRRVLKPGGACLVTAAPLFNANGFWIANRLAGVVPIRGLIPLRQHFVTRRQLERAMASSGLGEIRVHGVYTGPINWVEKIAPRLVPRFLEQWEPLDAALADRPWLREIANMFLARGVR